MSDPATERSPLQARLAAARAAVASERPAIQPRPEPTEAVPLTPAQATVWLATQLQDGSGAYNVPTVLRLRGRLDATALVAALRALADRHHVLRSLVQERGGRPVACVVPASAVPVRVVEVRPEQLETVLHDETERPFALAVEPPMRAALLRSGPEEHVLALTLHHVATDGWSQDLLLRELAALYSARLGSGQEPPPPRLQYADYAAWLAADANADASQADAEWWVGRLAGLAPVLDLPADRPRPVAPDWSAATVPVSLAPELDSRVRATAVEHACSPFVVLLAAWQALLARVCGTDDVPVAVPESGRHHSDTEGVVGCFVNTLVLRTDLSGEPSGRDLLARVRDVALEAYAHARAPFEQVVARTNPLRTLDATPLAQVQLNVFDAPAEHAFARLRTERHEPPPETAKYDLSLALVDERTGFRGGLVYRRELFDEATARAVAAWYLHLLDGMLADLERPVATLPLAPHAGPLLAGPARSWPLERPLHAFVEDQVDADPDATAVVAPDGTLTYAQLERRANALAHRLLEAGVQPNEPVGVLLEASTALPCALLGILKAGAGYLPLDTTYPAERIRGIFTAAGVRQSVTLAAFADAAGPGAILLDDPAALAGRPVTRPAASVAPESLLHVIFTSGSTGAPKGVAVSHRGAVNYLHSVLDRLGDVAGGSFAMVSTPAADFGLTCVYGALATGGTLHLVAREVAMDAAAFAAYMEAHEPDVLKCVPSHLELLARHGELADVLPRRLLVLAGEACPWTLVDRALSARPDLRIQSHYGHTETTMISLVCDVDQVHDDARGDVVPLGTPLANVVGHVVDRAGRPLPVGAAGELLVGGPGVARGYVGRPDLTAERFVREPGGTGRAYRSGDRVRVRHDGTVTFLGRLDDQVKIRGYRVEPGEVASVLRAVPGVAEAIVLAVGDGLSRTLAAWVVSPGADPAGLREALRQQLPEYMVPTSITIVERLPLTPNGKVDRGALPRPEPARQGERVAPETVAQRRVAAVFSDILGAPDVSLDDDFFALGGDSFAAVKAARAVDPQLRVIDLFTHPTVRTLAAFLDARSAPRGLLQHLPGAPTRGDAPATVIAVPYGGGSAAVFAPLASALAEHGMPLLAVELPGHDASRPDERLLSLDELVERLADEVAATVPGPVVLYGHCVGSAVATALADRLEAAGRPVLGVVAAASFPSAPLPGRFSKQAARLLGERWVSRRLQREALLVTGGLGDQLDEAATATIIGAMRHDALQAEEWFGRELAGADRRRLRCPVLCLVGERDRMTDLYSERYREWGALAERVDVATVPRAGHYFLRHQPEDVASLIHRHVAAWSAGTLPAPVDVAMPAASSLRPFYTVAVGQLVSLVGSALSAFALAVWAYQRSGRIFDLALVVMLSQVPNGARCAVRRHARGPRRPAPHHARQRRRIRYRDGGARRAVRHGPAVALERVRDRGGRRDRLRLPAARLPGRDRAARAKAVPAAGKRAGRARREHRVGRRTARRWRAGHAARAGGRGRGRRRLVRHRRHHPARGALPRSSGSHAGGAVRRGARWGLAVHPPPPAAARAVRLRGGGELLQRRPLGDDGTARPGLRGTDRARSRHGDRRRGSGARGSRRARLGRNAQARRRHARLPRRGRAGDRADGALAVGRPRRVGARRALGLDAGRQRALALADPDEGGTRAAGPRARGEPDAGDRHGADRVPQRGSARALARQHARAGAGPRRRRPRRRLRGAARRVGRHRPSLPAATTARRPASRRGGGHGERAGPGWRAGGGGPRVGGGVAVHLVTPHEVGRAAARIRPHVRRTRLLHLAEWDLWLKAECEQASGSFKLRGAVNAMALLAAEGRSGRVVAQSSGNHGRALAHAAARFGLAATVVLPDTAPRFKVDAVRALGASVVLVPPAERESAALELSAALDAPLVGSDARPVIAGHGSVALEIGHDLPGVEVVLVPVCNGGLLAGVATVLANRRPRVRVFGVEPELAADAAESVRRGALVRWAPELTYRTVADGLRAPQLGVRAWEHVSAYVDGIVTVSETQIVAAMRLLRDEAGILAEPSGAVAPAAHLFRRELLPAGVTVAIVSGGNVAPDVFRRLVGEPVDGTARRPRSLAS